MSTERELIVQLTKALRGVAQYLPKPDGTPATEIHITSVKTGHIIAGCITHYDPEVMDVFEAIAAAEKAGFSVHKA